MTGPLPAHGADRLGETGARRAIAPGRRMSPRTSLGTCSPRWASLPGGRCVLFPPVLCPGPAAHVGELAPDARANRGFLACTRGRLSCSSRSPPTSSRASATCCCRTWRRQIGRESLGRGGKDRLAALMSELTQRGGVQPDGRVLHNNRARAQFRALARAPAWLAARADRAGALHLRVFERNLIATRSTPSSSATASRFAQAQANFVHHHPCRPVARADGAGAVAGRAGVCGGGTVAAGA